MRIETIKLNEFPVITDEIILERVVAAFSGINLNCHKDVLMIVDDHTRPNTHVPRIVLDYLIETVGEERVAVIVASGMHRACSYPEIENKLGHNVKKVRLYSHNPMATPSPFFDKRDDYFRVGINTALPHLLVGGTSCGKLITPGLSHFKNINDFHLSPHVCREAIKYNDKLFDISFEVYIDERGYVIDIDTEGDKFKSDYYTIDMPSLTDVAELWPYVKWRDFQQTMNAINLLKYSPLVKPHGTIAFYSSTPEGIGVHYLFQQPNGIRPVKYDEIFSMYFSGKTLAFIMPNLNYKSIQEYFNEKILFFYNRKDFHEYAKYIYGDDAVINCFQGADMMIGRNNEQSTV